MGLMFEVMLEFEPMSTDREIQIQNSRFCDLGNALILQTERDREKLVVL